MAQVLVVDDEAEVRQLMRRSLESAGHRVTEAADGLEALHHFSAVEFDLVITDLVMPEKEGVETIAAMIKLNPRTKIIAISGGGRIGPVDYLALALRLGALQTLAKPFSTQELIDAVESVLSAATR